MCRFELPVTLNMKGVRFFFHDSSSIGILTSFAQTIFPQINKNLLSIPINCHLLSFKKTPNHGTCHSNHFYYQSQTITKQRITMIVATWFTTEPTRMIIIIILMIITLISLSQQIHILSRIFFHCQTQLSPRFHESISSTLNFRSKHFLKQSSYCPFREPLLHLWHHTQVQTPRWYRC